MRLTTSPLTSVNSRALLLVNLRSDNKENKLHNLRAIPREIFIRRKNCNNSAPFKLRNFLIQVRPCSGESCWIAKKLHNGRCKFRVHSKRSGNSEQFVKQKSSFHNPYPKIFLLCFIEKNSQMRYDIPVG